MKYYELDKEEQALVDLLEQDNLKLVDSELAKKELIIAAREAMNKTRI